MFIHINCKDKIRDLEGNPCLQMGYVFPLSFSGVSMLTPEEFDWNYIQAPWSSSCSST